jgi:CPA1 family monovalent cation:H+ antiporter
VLFWGGLRGAISLALALSLTTALPDRGQLQAMAFGVVLFTLVVEGLTMKTLIARSGIIQTSAARLEYEKRHARVIALQSSQNHLKQLKREGLISDYTWRIIKPFLDERSKTLANLLRETLENEPHLHHEELADAYREAIRSQRSTLTELFQDNIISQETYEGLVAEVDAMLIDPESTWTELAVSESLLKHEPVIGEK